ncbi:MAG: hypothetical protein ACYDDF_01895 [Thermoplasmatota archaeon]
MMMGAFARMFGSQAPQAGHSFHGTVAGPTKEVHDMGLTSASEAQESPPDAFVSKVSEEGGTVYVSPFLERLLAGIRRKTRAGKGAGASAQEPPGGPPRQ